MKNRDIKQQSLKLITEGGLAKYVTDIPVTLPYFCARLIWSWSNIIKITPLPRQFCLFDLCIDCTNVYIFLKKGQWLSSISLFLHFLLQCNCSITFKSISLLVLLMNNDSVLFESKARVESIPCAYKIYILTSEFSIQSVKRVAKCPSPNFSSSNKESEPTGILYFARN